MGHTDMRKGMQGLALQVQQGLKRDPHGGDLFVFRGRTGSLIKIIWHDGIGMSLYSKRLEKGRFVWPSAKDGIVSLVRRRDIWHRSGRGLAESEPRLGVDVRRRACGEASGDIRWFFA
ncbi:IS66 family insertion sequence element accessory protein TnpB [Novosphingobium sp. YJ-S2-02]|uniref:IS66 family insertion sequence element accessory protein TnpB n=2 Tax=Novosphingobium aureum TaxID=2792964 RepID=A0A931HH06_9SPHN|nr:IS66 family insertion sequence element accessory protein TnpB [Novosphingobium aureum]